MSDIPLITQKKINALLHELRSWPPGGVCESLQSLAKRFDLSVFVVDRLAKAEGINLPSNIQEDKADPNASTLDLDPQEVRDAVEGEDPDWEDKDTGVWRRKPSGEWELIEDSSTD